MKTLVDPANALVRGLSAIRTEFHVPQDFPPEVLAAAEAAATRVPDAHADRTALPFVTLDPASSTDLDQAFTIEAAGSDLLLHYAIADIGWFVRDGEPVDVEAWERGTTLYLPDGKAPLYPPVLSQGAASLLPDGPRPAIIFTVRVAPDGGVRLDGAERALIRSRAKLAYDSVTEADLPPGFAELSRRIADAEAARGAARVDPPEQEVERLAGGGYTLRFRPRLQSEEQNSALSLATNMAVADAMIAHHTGLFRVMGRPSPRSIDRLRHEASALGIDWPADRPLESLERSLDPADARHAAFMLAIRRAGDGASYMPWREDQAPWHSAVAAAYAHATAPLRRLADRYVVETVLAIANDRPVPDAAQAAFAKLPRVMARADARSGQIERAVIDLAEAVMLQGREGERFEAVVTDVDPRGARIRLCGQPIVARIAATDIGPGDRLALQLSEADPDRLSLTFDIA
jgi:exoribonuclease R